MGHERGDDNPKREHLMRQTRRTHGTVPTGYPHGDNVNSNPYLTPYRKQSISDGLKI